MCVRVYLLFLLFFRRGKAPGGDRPPEKAAKMCARSLLLCILAVIAVVNGKFIYGRRVIS